MLGNDSWNLGEKILVRHIWRDRVWEAAPVTVVQDEPERLVFYLRAGTPAIATKVDHDTGTLEGPFDYTWLGSDVLIICGVNDSHAVWAMWKAGGGRFLGWYVNLQDKFRRVADGIVTWDRSLDIQVTPDLQWNWKDEDHFARIQALGWITSDEAASIRAEGERVIERIDRCDRPFCESWPEWRPDPNWTIPDLPENWAVLPAS